MKIQNILIKDIGGIKELNLEFNSGLNLICGMNGVGKTTVLECIINTFSTYLSGSLKRSSRAESGSWQISIDGTTSTYSLQKFSPFEDDYNHSSLSIKSKSIVYVKEQRSIPYRRTNIVPDEVRDDNTYASYIVGGVQSETIKTWFINRAAFISQGRFTEAEVHNFEIAKSFFSLLDSDVEYSHIAHDTIDIIIKTTRGEVYLEYLSSGFKSCVYIVLGIIKEIEFNFKNPNVKVDEFEGVILIDEADAHLHPYWQGVFITVLKKVFKNAQIILTTHSPHMIQEANSEELIPLGIGSDGEVCLMNVIQNEYGFKGWTIEEILEDVMGLKETQSNDYLIIKDQFEKALDNVDIYAAKKSYEILKKMLHPRSPMRKVYELQLGSLG
ncbi:AAA family ATPase [Paenibacillus donghaensis]|uniref:Chromosome segregation protein SMC n=1 Tax=Paenibacillus donghaensis TaxID=414771 RepID=A0A2Z2K982_9BACL|nr:AAA family ATPase [Paenibacillus donghaensis]ASA21937.1 chromosome segregation protein SMC [Paenibacillus donghaensis]